MPKTSKAAEAAQQYRVTLKEAIRVGGLTLRPGQPHVVSQKVLDANLDKIATKTAI